MALSPVAEATLQDLATLGLTDAQLMAVYAFGVALAHDTSISVALKEIADGLSPRRSPTKRDLSRTRYDTAVASRESSRQKLAQQHLQLLAEE